MTHTGAMIALVPSEADRERLTVPNGQDPQNLHLTVCFWADAAELSDDFRLQMHRAAVNLAVNYGPRQGRGFGAAIFNPDTEDQCLVLEVNGEDIAQARSFLSEFIGSGDGHVPWNAHVTLRYGRGGTEVAEQRVGDILFTEVRVSIGDTCIDYPFTGSPATPEEVMEAPMEYASMVAAVNSSTWSSLPIADRDTPFSADDAIARISSWAGSNAKKFGSPFLWYNTKSKQPLNPDMYRLPIADVVNGRLVLIPRAVFSAGTILSGGHGYLEGVVDEKEREQLKSVLTDIYNKLQELYQDPRVVAPWLRGRTPAEREEEEAAMNASATDAFAPEDEPVVASGGPLKPPKEWFTDPNLTAPTPLVVTADGRVYGHLAAWNVCHAGITNKCVLAPHTTTGYKYFRNGTVLTADGSFVKVGRLTVGIGHADPRWGYVPAAEHYDDSGTAVAVVASGEDGYGIWVAGAVVPGASEEKIAELRRSPLSGDWRRVPEGNLELVAALAVNTPGFPIVEFGSDGVQASLVAAGVVVPEGVEVQPTPEQATAIRAERLSAIDTMLAAVDRAAKVRRFRKIMDKF